MAPSVVGESLKGAALLANVMGKQLGYPCNPPVLGHRTDIVQAVQLNDRKKVWYTHIQSFSLHHLITYFNNCWNS